MGGVRDNEDQRAFVGRRSFADVMHFSFGCFFSSSSSSSSSLSLMRPGVLQHSDGGAFCLLPICRKICAHSFWQAMRIYSARRRTSNTIVCYVIQEIFATVQY